MKWLAKWDIRQKRMLHALRDTYVHRMIGERLFDHHIWGFDVEAFARGVAMGVFVAFIPIPFQMLICAIGAITFRVNLPISLAMTWLTNPLTSVPIIWLSHHLGRYLLRPTQVDEWFDAFFCVRHHTGEVIEHGLYLWTGSLIIAIALAILGYLVVRVAAKRLRHLIHEWEKLHRRHD